MSEDAIVHSDDVSWSELGHGEHIAHRRRRLSSAAGGRGLGCSLIELGPGKTAWPFHYHLGNEEAIYVLEGEATLRLGPAHHRVRAGNYIALCAEEGLAHQMTNTGTEPCRYLVISTMTEPDIAVYPDSKKIGVFAGSAPGGDKEERTLGLFLPRDAAVGYWEGEPVGEVSADSKPDEPDIEQRIDEEIDVLKSKLGIDRLASASARVRAKIEEKVETLKAAVGRKSNDEPEVDQKLEQQIDDEIDQLKKKLGLE